MKKYVVKNGDTLQLVAQKFYYNTSRYPEIAEANNIPSDSPLVEGQVLKIPSDEIKSKEVFDFTTIGIIIDNKKFEFWDNLVINFSFDKLAPEFSFTTAYEQLDSFKEAFEPFSYKDIEIYYKNEKILSGLFPKISYSSSENGNIVNISGYGRPGLLQSVTLPLSLYPRTLYNVSLQNIAEKYCKPFGIFIDIDSDAIDLMNKEFKSTKIGVNQTIADYIINLAKQRGLTVSSSPEGFLLFSLKNPNKDNAVFTIDGALYAMTANYDGDAIYSDYSALLAKSRKTVSKIAKKSLDIDIFRHHTITKNSSDDGDLTSYLDSEVGRTLLKAHSFTLDLPFWETSEGNLFQPNDLIITRNPAVRIEQDTKLSVRQASYSLSSSGRKVSLNLVPQSALNNEFERFWDG